ncbi:GTPase-activating protein CdGAPr isoform X2 [Haemaphysalis longicornis]
MENLRAQNPTVSSSPASVRIKDMPRNAETGTRFPKLGECAHFHYDMMDLGTVQMSLVEWSAAGRGHDEADKENREQPNNQLPQQTPPPSIPPQQQQQQLGVGGGDGCCGSAAAAGGPGWWAVQVTSRDKSWTLRRSYDNFRLLDEQLHRCVYDRQHSRLPELPDSADLPDDAHEREAVVRELLADYLGRFSCLVGNLVSCGSVLNWLELDNRGHRLLVTDESAINTPAVAAAYVVRSYAAQAPDEISFQVGDMVSVIDMPPADESMWWRGKRGFEVGFFPSECVQVIGDKIPHNLKIPTKPVLRKHGKLIAFFRSFLLSRPSRRKLKQSGILRERVFGCDLGEHLTNTGRDVPLVLTSCAKFIEQFGIVDGIYRLSGVTSNIQKLRVTFDEDRVPDLNEEEIRQDIHCVASLLKMYFRELPNPLLTYQLYDKFVAAMQLQGNNQLLRVREVVKELPPPHYRTLETLVRHLAVVAAHGDRTGMTAKNVAIVWAPNLLRSKDLEVASVGALHVIGVQAVLTEYLICYVDLIFNDKMPAYPSSPESLESTPRRGSRPKSLAISTPTKLLSLEEARSRALSSNLPGNPQQKYIDVGGGPDSLPAKYHTVIELPHGKRGSGKLKKSPLGWKSFFARGWHSGSTREKDKHGPGLRKASTGSLPHHQSLPIQDKALTEADLTHSASKQLRSVKSAESLISSGGHSGRNSDVLESCNSSSDASRVQPFQWLPEGTPASSPTGPHKHVRSVSHDSYFERGGLDMSLEDVHAVYGLGQQSTGGTSKQTAPACPRKSPRKQKLDRDSSDGASAKVQRLSDCSQEPPTFHSSQEAPTAEGTLFSNMATAPPSSHPASSSHPLLPTFATVPDEQGPDRRQQSSRSLTPYSSRQPLAVHSPDDIEPYTSPSPQEYPQPPSQFRNLAVPPQHGNEKMVLVEVHATEESDSSREMIDGGLVFHRPFVEDVDEAGGGQCGSASGSTDIDESENHVGTTSLSLAEDIATSLKMSCCQFDTDFLVGDTSRGASLETSFLNRVSASLPYIEDTDTSASPLSSPCAGCELLPLEASTTRSTPSPIDVQQSEVCGGNSSEQMSPSLVATSVVDECLETAVSVMPEDDGLRTFVDSELSGHGAHGDMVQRVEALNCSVVPADGSGTVAAARESSSSDEEEDHEEAMPYSYLDESPLLSDACSAMLHSQSQDQNLCLLSPREATAIEGEGESPDLIEAKDITQELLSSPEEECRMQEESCIAEPAPMVCDESANAGKEVPEGTKHMLVNVACSDDKGPKTVCDQELPVTREDYLLNSSPETSLNSTHLPDHDVVLETASHLDTAISPSRRDPVDIASAAKRETCFENTAASDVSLTEVQNSTTVDPQCVMEPEPLELVTEPVVTTLSDETEAKLLIDFSEDEVQLRSSPRPARIVEAKRKSETARPNAAVEAERKRLSEPPHYSRSEKRGSVKELMSKFEPADTHAGNPDLSPSKTCQPSLFTQLKVMRLQSLKNPSSPSTNYDPWSDPILDQEDRDDCLGHMEEVLCIDSTPKSNEASDEVQAPQKAPQAVEHPAQESEVDSPAGEIVLDLAVSDGKARPSTLELRKVNIPTQATEKRVDQPPVPKVEASRSSSVPPVESEVSRMRIEKIKEERRAQLREKLKSESSRCQPDEAAMTKAEAKLKRTSDDVGLWNVDVVPLRQANRENERQQMAGVRSWPTNKTTLGDQRKRDSVKQTTIDVVDAAGKKPPIGRTSPVKTALPTKTSPVKGLPTKTSPVKTSPAKSQPLRSPSQQTDAITRRQDLSPPKRIRDRAAMFECRSQKEQARPAPPRLARADLSSF